MNISLLLKARYYYTASCNLYQYYQSVSYNFWWLCIRAGTW